MARNIGADGTMPLYRAVITKKYRNSEPFTSYEGPYTTEGAAKARVTFWANYLEDRDYATGEVTTESWATGYVEQGEVTWSAV